MPRADRAEDPAPLGRAVARDRLEHAVEREELLLEARVLRMHVEDRIARARSTQASGSMPCQNRCEGSKLTPTLSPALSRSRTHRGGVVDDEARVRLDRDANPVPLRERRGVGPVGKHALVPLPRERLREVVRPRARDPARPQRVLGLARAAGERDHGVDAELGREPHGVAVGLVRAGRDRADRDGAGSRGTRAPRSRARARRRATRGARVPPRPRAARPAGNAGSRRPT